MSDNLESVRAIEIVLSDGSPWYTTEYPTVAEVRSAIDRDEPLKCFWLRADGTRFEEDIWFNKDQIKLIRTNRS